MSGTVPASFANQFFNATFYLENNPDVVAGIAAGNFTSALQHFELFGQFENRMPNASFNANQYLINNPDVAAAVGARTIGSAWEHFVTFGVAENRSDGSFPGTFNETAYLAANPDVAAAVAAGDYINGYEHFLLYGQFENRPGTPTGAPGQTFTLTTGADIIPGLIGNGGSANTTGNDTIVGIVSNKAGVSTLNAADNLHPTGANETLSLTAQDAATTMPAAILNGISTLDVRNVGTKVFTADASLMPGVTAVNSNLSDGNTFSDVTFTNVPSGTSVGDIGNGVASSSSLTATYVAAATLATVNISGGTKVGTAVSPANVTINGTGVTSTTVSSAGAANKIGALKLPDTGTTLTVNAATNLTAASVQDAKLTTITAAGAATSVGLGSLALAPLVTTITASGLTAGGVSVSKVGPALTTFTGGGGNDSLDFAAGAISASQTLDGGAGTNTLGIEDAGVLAAATYAAVNATKNFETLALNGGAATTADVSKITNATFTKLAVNNSVGGLDTINNLDTGHTLSLIAAAGGVTVNAALGSPPLNLSIDGPSATAGASVAGAGLTIGGSPGITLTSNGTAGAPDNSINKLVTEFNATVTVKGSQNLTIGPTGLQFGPGGAGKDQGILDASGFTGKLTVTADPSGKNTQTISVGSGGSVVDLTKADVAAILNLGAGTDQIKFLNGNASGLAGGTDIATANSFTAGAGGDALSATGGVKTYTALSSGQLTTIAGEATLGAALDAAAADIKAALPGGGWTAFTFGADTYAENTSGTATFTGTANVIDLKTTAVASLTQSNFV